MNLLLDTCAVLFLSADAPEIKDSTRSWVEQSDSIFLASVTAAELACLQDRGRIELPDHWKPWFREAVSSNGWRVLPADWEVMEEAYSLPGTFHPDPADRMITATARVHRLTILTTDRKLFKYPHVNAVW